MLKIGDISDVFESAVNEAERENTMDELKRHHDATMQFYGYDDEKKEAAIHNIQSIQRWIDFYEGTEQAEGAKKDLPEAMSQLQEALNQLTKDSWRLQVLECAIERKEMEVSGEKPLFAEFFEEDK